MINYGASFEEKTSGNANEKALIITRPLILSRRPGETMYGKMKQSDFANICNFINLMKDFIKIYEKNANAPIVAEKVKFLEMFIYDWLHPDQDLTDSHQSQHTGSRGNKSRFNEALQKNPFILTGLAMCCIKIASKFFHLHKNDDDEFLKSKQWHWIIALPFSIGTGRNNQNIVNDIFIDGSILMSDHQDSPFHTYPVDGRDYQSNPNVQYIDWESFKESCLSTNDSHTESDVGHSEVAQRRLRT